MTANDIGPRPLVQVLDNPSNNDHLDSEHSWVPSAASALSSNLCTVLPARNTARGVLVLNAVQTAPSSCVLAISAPDSTSTPRTLSDTALDMASVAAAKQGMMKRAVVTMTNGEEFVFDYGMLSVKKLVATIQSVIGS